LSGKNSTDGGFALILVVWFLVLVGAIGAYLVANGRNETAIAHNVQAAASAEALADAGIGRIVFNQSDSVLSNRWKLDGASHIIMLPAGQIEIRLADETRKINPNLASDTLLAALFEVCGVERNAARRLGAAVADWVSAEKPDKEGAVKADPYRAAGRSYGAPHAPIESLDELGLVLGMTPEILTSVRPYLSIYTEAASPDAKTAPLAIQRALAIAAKTEGGDEDDRPASAAPSSPPTQAAGASAPQIGAVLPPAQGAGAAVPPAAAPAAKAASGEQRLIEAQITAQSRDGGVFVRYAVLRLEQEGPKAYAVLDWRRGTLDDAPRQPAANSRS
jgi:general secretion pathway protein K